MSGIVAGSKHAGPRVLSADERDQAQGINTLHLGLTLRSLYEGSVDKQPITDTQIDLILRLRSKERALRSAS